MKKLLALWLVWPMLVLLLISCREENAGDLPGNSSIKLKVTVSPVRAVRGEALTVKVAVEAPKALDKVEVKASLSVPSGSLENLILKPVSSSSSLRIFQSEIKVEPEFPDGLYTITATGKRGDQMAVGKGSFLLGQVVGDFMIISELDGQDLEEDIRSYYQKFKKAGGNFVIIHSLVTPDRAFYPSRICSRPASPGSGDDRVGLALRLAGEYGLTSLLSVSWDMTRDMPYSECLDSTKKIMAELWKLYQAEPALAGFYNYQEGSGTYLVSQMREFAAAAKSLNPGLLVACSPYIDDPLLSGYLAAIDELDIIIYQGAVMASYRPDNRRCFPVRRVKDFASLSAGATRVRNKITLSHVELFGYLEKQYAGQYLASPEDIQNQILSAAATYGPDGIVFFTYHANIHEMGKKISEVADCERAVEEGIKAFKLISSRAAISSSHIGLYIPYSDWWADRWTNSIVPALDAFRRLGVSPDLVPFVPPRGEEILPYYPYHLNEEQLEFLLKNRYVLVLSDVAGMQDTDSLLLKEFVKKGGVVILFGPQIPYGDKFDREELCGAREEKGRFAGSLIIKKQVGKSVRQGQKLSFRPGPASSWQPTTAEVLATYEDGSPAVVVNEYGQGQVITVPISLAEAPEDIRSLTLDLLDMALNKLGWARLFDIIKTSASREIDWDIAQAEVDRIKYLAVVNYGEGINNFKVVPLNLKSEANYVLKNELTGEILQEFAGRGAPGFSLSLRASEYILLSLSAR